MASITLRNVGVSFPFFFAGDRSFKWKLLRSMALHSSAPGRTTVEALADVTLSIAGGARLAVVGGNAAGKTTLLRVMGGLLPPSTGQIAISGRANSLLGTGIGIDLAFTARQTIIGQGLLMGFPLAACRSSVAHAVEFGELTDILDRPLHTLAQGHQVRLGLSIAVAYNAEILLIDEMLEHLSPAMIDRLCRYIESEMPHQSIVVLAERSRSLLERICNEAIVLNQGRLVDQASLSDVVTHHQLQFTN
jgi:ABC-type polysaccharide/polyol phosphate transport system ATPase subunit